MMEQTSLAPPIDAMLDHRSDISDANSVDSYVFTTKAFCSIDCKCSRAFSIDNGVVNTPEAVEHSTSAATLMNELQRVKEDLKHKDIEIRRANEIRENTDREIEDLTASLFEVRSRSIISRMSIYVHS